MMHRSSLLLTACCTIFMPISSLRKVCTSICSPHRLIENLHMSSMSSSSSTAMPLLEDINDRMNVILASASPRRRELLTLMGLKNFRVVKSDFAEDLDQSIYPDAVSYCLDTAIAKAADVVSSIEKSDGYQRKGTILIGSDTIVEIEGKILEKPKDVEDAYKMISILSGQTHKVHTAVVLFGNGPANDEDCSVGKLVKLTSFVESTSVKFVDLAEKDKIAYIESREGFDKAGGYGIQGLGGQMVEKIDGCYFNVMGLPISKLSKALAALHDTEKIK